MHKNHVESVSSTRNPENISPWRKIVAIGALSTVALTGCATHDVEAQPKPTTTQQSETPSAEKPGTAFETAVPKFRDDWKVNRESLIALYEKCIEQKVRATPECEALRGKVRAEFLANNPLPDGLKVPGQSDSPKDIEAYHWALSDLYRQYYSDVYRDQVIDWTNGHDDDKLLEDGHVLYGLDLALFNGVRDDLQLRDKAYRLHLVTAMLPNDNGGGDAHDSPLPAITSYVPKNWGQMNSLSGYPDTFVLSTVTMEGRDPLDVTHAFRWNDQGEYWDLVAERHKDPATGVITGDSLREEDK